MALKKHAARLAKAVISTPASLGQRIAEKNQQWLKGLELKDLDQQEKVFLAVCQDIYRKERGCYTPFEKFICALVQDYEFGLPLSPSALLQDEALENFKCDYEDMAATAHRFIGQYPEIKEQEGEAAA